MKTSTIVSIVIIILIVVLGGWWLMSSNSMPAAAPTAQNQNTQPETAPTPAPVAATPAPETTTPATTPATPPAQTSTPVLKVSSSAGIGNYLASSSNGMTLYTYTKDSTNVSNCTGSCAVNWPPYTVTGKAPFVAVGSLSGKISTFIRADGSIQLTYNGMPLYFWINDQKPGDVTGQGVGGFVVAKP